ncbi:hypothetical protein [Streptomyces sp. NPDC096351]|uniref:hypothetical protein n=1 Tax=Streptomyces sp. NPDC096351 TaxID=3366087 RepID=UPI003800C14F
MISEPELDGDTVHASAELMTEARDPRPPRPHRPWLWALGGAAVASAVWGGGLYAVQRGEDPGPDLGGYKTVADLCRTAKLGALTTVLGKRYPDNQAEASRAPELEVHDCAVLFGSPESGFSGSVTYTRHLVTDPGPEFDARAARLDLKPYAGLGEKAYQQVSDFGAQLIVLDGQVEIEISFTSMASWNEDGAPKSDQIELDGIEIPLGQDMLALMAALKR